VRGHYGDSEDLQLRDDAVQVGLVEDFAVEDGLGRCLADPQIGELGSVRLAQCALDPKLEPHADHRPFLVSGRSDFRAASTDLQTVAPGERGVIARAG
jgi:hypothetical protein